MAPADPKANMMMSDVLFASIYRVMVCFPSNPHSTDVVLFARHGTNDPNDGHKDATVDTAARNLGDDRTNIQAPSCLSTTGSFWRNSGLSHVSLQNWPLLSVELS
jgi:hypothetical protein